MVLQPSTALTTGVGLIDPAAGMHLEVQMRDRCAAGHADLTEIWPAFTAEPTARPGRKGAEVGIEEVGAVGLPSAAIRFRTASRASRRTSW